jgi:hypothetical protein
MPIQSDFGRIGFSEDFNGYNATASIADGTAGTRYNDLTFAALGGQTELFFTVDESGGVVSANGAGAAGNGMAFWGAPMVPSSNGTLRMEARFKGTLATDLRVFVGWQETVAVAEPLNPFTLSGTALTTLDGGNTVGFYTDTSADTDDYRFHSSLDGTETTAAALSDALQGETTLGALGVRALATITADSWVIARVEIDVAGNAEGWIGAVGMANQNGLTRVARMKSGTLDVDALYHPILILAAGSTGDPLLECDYIWAKGNRDWSA